LFEVAGAQRGDEVIPQTAVANGFARQINVPLDGDRYADDEDQGQWVEEKPTVLEKIDDRIEEIHLRAPKNTRPSLT
jgi:hypothetical protein